MHSQPVLSAFVLAGGASTRMGTDKALLPFEGVPLIEHALRKLRAIGLAPRILGSRPDLEQYAPILPDLRPQCGPLAGIEAGLLASETDTAIFIPIDVPILPVALLRLLIERMESNLAPATIPRMLGQAQPLTAIYRRELLPAISLALATGDYKVMRVVQQGAAALSQTPDIFDLETVLTAAGNITGWPTVLKDAFINCNAPTDLAQVEHRRARAYPQTIEDDRPRSSA